MISFIHRTGIALAAAAILSAALAMVPERAISADRSQLAQTSSPPTAATPAKRTPADRVEARIKSLHDQLKITAAQEPQWRDVAQVMRENAKAISDLVLDRVKDTKAMTAVDDLRSYQALAEAHAAGVRKLIPVFEALHATMSDAQKRNADAVFRHRPRRAGRR